MKNMEDFNRAKALLNRIVKLDNTIKEIEKLVDATDNVQIHIRETNSSGPGIKIKDATHHIDGICKALKDEINELNTEFKKITGIKDTSEIGVD